MNSKCVIARSFLFWISAVLWHCLFFTSLLCTHRSTLNLTFWHLKWVVQLITLLQKSLITVYNTLYWWYWKQRNCPRAMLRQWFRSCTPVEKTDICEKIGVLESWQLTKFGLLTNWMARPITPLLLWRMKTISCAWSTHSSCILTNSCILNRNNGHVNVKKAIIRFRLSFPTGQISKTSNHQNRLTRLQCVW